MNLQLTKEQVKDLWDAIDAAGFAVETLNTHKNGSLVLCVYPKNK